MRRILASLCMGLLLCVVDLPSLDAGTSRNPQVLFKTSSGTILVELYPGKAPETVRNFLQYVDDRFYDGTIFHRVIPAFVIQGGGYGVDLKKKETRPPIPNEASNGVKNVAGTLAMARSRAPDSATSQFFFNLRDNPALDHREGDPASGGYAVFGRVIDGMAVLDRIKGVPTARRDDMSDVPETPVIVESIRRVR